MLATSVWIEAAVLLAGMAFVGPVAFGAEPKPPDLKPKAYRIGIAPSHITIPTDELFRQSEQWGEVAGAIQMYKYYGVQAVGVPWAKPVPTKPLAEFARVRGVQLSCEFGSFHLPLGKRDPVQAAIQQLKPVFDAGGKVAYLSLDGPDCRLLKGCVKHRDALSLDQLSGELVKFWQGVHKVYPEIRIGLISNYPNWDFSRKLPGYNGHNTDASGVTCEEMLNKVHAALTAAGEKLDYVEIDNPYNYYVEKRTRKGDAVHDGARNLLAIQKWCEEHKAGFHLIVNAEPRGQGGKGFHDLTVAYVRRLRQDGVFPDLFLIQSWYEQPSKNLPEGEADTFMNAARDTIRAIRELYPRPPAPRPGRE